MAKIEINIPDNKVQEAIDLLCSKFGYRAQIRDGEGGMIPNPETKQAFAKRQIIGLVKNACLSERYKQKAADAETEVDGLGIS